MALRGAISSGNWSNPAIWNGGVLPTAGDIVASNNFTVTIDQNINVDSLTNAAVTDPGLVPTMTSDTTPSGVVSASSVLNPSLYQAWKAFDKNNSTFWASNTSGPPQWLEYQFPSPTIVNGYILLASNTDAPVTWEFQAWNGSTWVVLQSIVNAPKVGTATTYNFTNTTAYSRYRIYMLAPYSQGYMAIHELTLRNSLSLASSTAGGGFILNDGVTVTCTGSAGILAGPSDCLTFSGSGTSTINSNISPTTSNVNATTLVHSGTGTLNLVGSVFGHGASLGNRTQTMLFSGTGIFNITGDINGLQTKTGFTINGSGTCNLIGNLYPGNAGIAITVSGNATVNITGTIFPLTGGSSLVAVLWISAISAVVTVTGNVFLSSTTSSKSPGIVLTTSRLNVIGNVYGNTDGYNTISSGSSNSYIDITGSIIAVRGAIVFNSTSINAINILSGPFICSDTGVQPIFVARMHYRMTSQSYYEFRDNSTNGANPPAAQAPATRLVSPDTIIGGLLPSDVRSGIVYSAGSLVGTMIVPSPTQVVNGIPVDNTIGTAILDATSIWAVPLTSINTLNSIGRRVKNAATVESTGAQIQQTLNNNE